MHAILKPIKKPAGEAWIEAYFKTPEGKATARRFLAREAQHESASPTYPAGGMFDTDAIREHGTHWGRP